MIANLQSRYGLTRMPFTASVPAGALFASAAHKEAVARLRWLISACGLGILTGEVGAGKTAALRAAADGLDASRNTLVYLPNPQVGVRGLHGALATALGQAPRFHHATLIPQVEAALAAEADERNRNVILAIDESHMLTGDQLEAVRMMTNHNLDSGSPLTVLLIGQPTLRRRLRVGDMAALDQRVQLRCVIPSPAISGRRGRRLPPRPPGARRPVRHPLLRRRRPRHPLPRPRPAPRDQPPGDNRTARRLHRRENHRRRILRPHRHRRGHRDRLTTTTPPRPPDPARHPARRGHSHPLTDTLTGTFTDTMNGREHRLAPAHETRQCRRKAMKPFRGGFPHSNYHKCGPLRGTVMPGF